MPQVMLRMHRLLRRSTEGDSKDLDETPVMALEGESILELVRRLAAQDEFFRKNIYDETHQMIETNIVVVLNGSLVNPQERSSTILREGDEVRFISMFYGG